MIKKLWLTFSQALAVLLALYFMLETFRPDWVSILMHRNAHQLSNSGPGEGYRKAVEAAMPAVVNIFTSKKMGAAPKHPFFEDPEIRKFFGDDPEDNPAEDDTASSLGSGVIVSAEGYIVTNQHVVEDADTIEVSLNDGRKASAVLVGTDPETDLAVLKIVLNKLPVVQFAQEEQAQVGDVVLAMGNPFGVGQTVTMGIISALGRNHVGINTFENFIQTDAAINPGNSGGALVDTQGNLLGINTAIYSRSGGSLGIGFAIPAKTVQSVLNQIVRNGSVTRGYIGVEQQNITEELSKAFNLPQQDGVIIAGIVKDGPADKAGLKVGDILLAIDKQAIKDTTQMLNLIASSEPGQKRVIRLLREGKPVSLTIEIGVRPKPGDLLKK
ncbi:trypsin-like peptidase domain-containing protein [Limnobacter humi]|uniref:Trypsin-like peptidase domain-containing protein n=1 Tax=Limnobacter humi TaxID=1778671 RepID=A0ABT1WIX6_9BURK|nr:trypsin-like peptidase domain-containing protein [Limnobacter humi]MCQ8897476.1 trypsin-like peptidase domain-containing protein [Limnobacter humi]